LIRQIVLVSGPVGAGKTTLCEAIEKHFAASHFKSREYLLRIADPSTDPSNPTARDRLQQLGNKLDRRTNGEWIRGGVQEQISKAEDGQLILVDAVRIPGQIEAVRKAYGSYGYRVVHIHVTAPRPELERRYIERAKQRARQGSSRVAELKSYEDVLKDATERKVGRLARYADIVIDTLRNTDRDVLVRAASHLGLYGREYLRLCDVIVGGQFGSEGKGQVVGYLAKEYDYLVRVGGPNAGHSVYAEPKAYKYHHLPSGTRHSDAKLLIGAGAVINVPRILEEIANCQVDKDRLFIDPQAMVIEDADLEAERDLVNWIGSTGQGVGSATARRIMGRAGKNRRLARDVADLKPFTTRVVREILDDAFRQRASVLLEGTQGTGLSLYHGTYPWVTSRDTTAAGCLAEAGIAPARVRKVIMVTRTYPIRVQNPPVRGRSSGPLSHELSWEEIASRSHIPLSELRRTEKTTTTKRRRRIGEFDWELLRSSAALNGPTDVALTFVDYHTIKNRQAERFDQLDEDTIQFIEEVERVAGAPVSLIATKFHSRSIIDRRGW
jgi:adenylosuccinate synthase